MSTVKEEPVTTFKAQHNATKNKLPYLKRSTRHRSNRTGFQFSLLMRPPCLIQSEANRANIQDGCQCQQCLADRMDQIVER